MQTSSRPASPTPEDVWIQEVVSLITELYALLEKMRYLKPGAIQHAPHSTPVNTHLTALMGLTPSAITLLNSLPYVVISLGPFRDFVGNLEMSATNWRAYRYNNEFLLTTRLADMRDDGTLRRSRDPLYGDHGPAPKDGEFLYAESHVNTLLEKWQVAITGKNRVDSYWKGDNLLKGGVMILDLKTRCLFTVGDGAVKTKEYADGSSEDRGSLDPATRGMLAEDYKPPSIEDMDQWDLMAIEEGKEPEASAEDRAKIGTYASRPATEALRDYIRRFETLEWVPGFVEGDSATAYPRNTYKELYLAHGWPSNFDGDAFESARQKWFNEAKASYLAAEPFRDVIEKERRVNFDKSAIEGWKKDLLTLDRIDSGEIDAKAAKSMGYRAALGTYNGRTRDQTLNAIATVSKRLVDDEAHLEDAGKRAKEVDEGVRKNRDDIIAKYGGEWPLGS